MKYAFLRRSARPLHLALALTATLAACDTGGGDDTVEARVYATSNPTGLDQDAIVRLTTDLARDEATFNGLTGVTSVQSLTLTSDGDGYLTVDLANSLGGVVYLAALCDEDSDEGCANAGGVLGAGTRLIAGAATGLVAPKGLIVADGPDALVVADNGAEGSIRVFELDATGDATPTFVVTNAGANVWDVAYDEDDDRLFVARTDGVVAVYDDFFDTEGAGGPDRTITPSAAGEQISVNLHGIAYDEETDILVLTDVGDAANTTDGQLFTIASASTADGNVAVRYRLSGSTTRFGNPVDVALAEDGSVYVAEKSNDAVLRYDGILTATTTSGDPASEAPDAQIGVLKAESVAFANE